MARALALGFLIGFPIAASPGPIFFLVLRRTLSRGWRSGLVSGLGVATGDAIYAGLAAFGVAAITNVLLGQRRWIGLVGGVAIMLIGLRTLRAHPHPGPPPQARGGNPLHLFSAYGSMVALTLGNPATILSFIAVSPGPIFFLVLRRTLSRGWRSGVASGLGVATGDAVYAGLAAFGVAAITNVLLGQRRWIGLVGGVAIALIGLRTLALTPLPERLKRSPGTEAPLAWADGPAPEGEGNQGTLAVDYGSMVALTLSNPATILSFIAVFAGFGLRVGSGWQPAVALVAGVMLGSALWWLGFTAAVSVVRQRLTPAITRGIGIVAGLALIGFGTVAALSSLARPG